MEMTVSVLNETAVRIAQAYGSLTRALVERQNAERVRIAQVNFDASRQQITAAKDQKVAELAGVFQQHIGTVRANAAYRGVGGGSVAALIGSAAAEGEVARRNIDINANNQIGSAASQAIVPLDDPMMSQFQGFFQGLGIGSDFSTALASMPSTRVNQTTWVNTSLGWQALNSSHEVPQSFDLGSQFPELDSFLKG